MSLRSSGAGFSPFLLQRLGRSARAPVDRSLSLRVRPVYIFGSVPHWRSLLFSSRIRIRVIQSVRVYCGVAALQPERCATCAVWPLSPKTNSSPSPMKVYLLQFYVYTCEYTRTILYLISSVLQYESRLRVFCACNADTPEREFEREVSNAVERMASAPALRFRWRLPRLRRAQQPPLAPATSSSSTARSPDAGPHEPAPDPHRIPARLLDELFLVRNTECGINIYTSTNCIARQLVALYM